VITVSVKGVKSRNGYFERSGTAAVIVTVSGHAGFAEKGGDIVCSAVSVLVQSFTRSLAAKGIGQKIGSDDGSLRTVPDFTAMSGSEACYTVSALDMMIHGLLAVEKSFPGKVSISIEE
jgi:uncharacterized protein YsxB (DUF464 family)